MHTRKGTEYTVLIYTIQDSNQLSLDSQKLTTAGLDSLDLGVVLGDGGNVGIKSLARGGVIEVAGALAAKGADGVVVDEGEGPAGSLPSLTRALVAETTCVLAGRSKLHR